ncbi:MAG: hypothetical protein FGM43_01105 [Sinobacteraceae bacterium]|nr:hypothetical protein [Nevskiaceae bacterium]
MNRRVSPQLLASRMGVAVWVASALVACSPASNTSQPAASAGEASSAEQAVDPAVGAAREAVSLFYSALAKQRPSGAPTAEQRNELAQLMSRELIDLLQQADAVRAAARAAAPMEKPPFTDGDLFSSLFEGPTAFTVGEPQTGAAGEWRVPVTLAHSTGSADTKPTQWTDTVVLREESGRFVVTDIAFGGQWDFANKGTLLAGLRAGLEGQ